MTADPTRRLTYAVPGMSCDQCVAAITAEVARLDGVASVHVDLAAKHLPYLHVHPESDATAGRDIRFGVEYPSEGRYGLFLQFKHQGRVHSAVFTRDTEDEEVGNGHGH